MHTIRKILIGKLVKFLYNSNIFVIVGVRRNQYNKNRLDVLVAHWHSKDYLYSTCYTFNWFNYNPKDMIFIGRDSKENIRKCLKTRPEKIKYHLGIQIDMSKVKILDSTFSLYGKRDYYCEYLKSL